MPLGGETVGTAFVRILADGTGLGKSIEKEMTKQEDLMGAMGHEHSKRYQKGFEDEVKHRKGIQEALVGDMQEGFGRMAGDKQAFQGLQESIAKSMASSLSRSRQTETRKNAQTLGEIIARNVMVGWEKTGVFPDFQDPAALRRLIAQATEGINAEVKAFQDLENAAHSANKAFDAKAMARDSKALSHEIRKVTAEVTKGNVEWDGLEKTLGTLGGKIKEYNSSSSRTGKNSKVLRQEINSLREKFEAAGGATGKITRDLDHMERLLKGRVLGGFRKYNSLMDEVANSTGKALGKGGRNNAVNFFGALVRGMTKFLNIIPSGLEAIGGFVKAVTAGIGAFKPGFDSAQEAGKGFFQSVIEGSKQSGKAFSELATVAPEAALGIVGALVIAAPLILEGVGVIVSALSGLVGAAVALVGSLAFAAVGAITPLLGLVFPLAAAVGVLALAFAGMSKATRKTLAEGLKPITAEFKAMQKSVQGKLFGNVKEDGAKVASTLKVLSPLLDSTAVAIHGIAVSFLDATNSPGFKNFIANMKTFVPQALTSLGTIAKNALAGLGGMFQVAEPFALRFLGWVEKISAAFGELGGAGKTGEAQRKKLAGFFSEAETSARELWGLIKSIGSLLGTLLNSGKSTGDDLIVSMTKNVQKFVNYLKSPAGQKAMQQWFTQAGQIAKAIGQMVVQLGKFFDALDTPANRELARRVFDVMALALKSVGVMIQWLLPKVISVFQAVAQGLLGIVSTLAKIPGPQQKTFQSMATNIRANITALDNLNNAFDELTHPKKVVIDTSTSGYKQTIRELADIRYHVDGIDRSVTIGVTAKLSANAEKLLNDQGRGALAAGGLAMSARRVTIGEAGPEAVVPLARPLSMVDPAVRELSAIAQGKVPGMASGGVAGGGKVINVGGLTVITPTKDPVAVANETINKLVGAAYI